MIKDDFTLRHNGPQPEDVDKMLQTIGVATLDELIDKTIPASIRLKEDLPLPEGMTEGQYLAHVKELVEQNYEKYKSYGLSAGIFSASLGKKDWDEKAIFGSVQSVARSPNDFFIDFSLLVIDECHRVAEEGATQYQEVIKKLLE